MGFQLRTALTSICLMLLVTGAWQTETWAGRYRGSKTHQRAANKSGAQIRPGLGRHKVNSGVQLHHAKTNKLALTITTTRTGDAAKRLSPAKAETKAKTRAQAKAKAEKKARTKAKFQAKARARKKSRAARAKARREKSPKLANAAASAKRSSQRWLGKINRKFNRAFDGVVYGIRDHYLVNGVFRVVTHVSAVITRRLDVWQATAPPALGNAIRLARTYSPVNVLAFIYGQIKADKAFLGTYFAVDSTFSNFVLPSSVVFGVAPLVAGGINLMTLPIAFSVVILRHRHLRQLQGENLTYAESARSIGRSLVKYASQRQNIDSRNAWKLARSGQRD